MSKNAIIPADDVGAQIWALFEKCCDEQGLDQNGRHTVLKAISRSSFAAGSMVQKRGSTP